MYTIEEIITAYQEAYAGVNIEKNQEIVIESNNSEFAYYFAKYIKGADVEKLQQIIIDNQDTMYAYNFAFCVKGADIQRLSEVFINFGHEYWIKRFYKYMSHDKFDTSKFETYLTFM